jgi:hypothetical protein
MPYTRDQAIDFWFTFDDTFKDHTPPEVLQLYSRLFATGGGIDRFWLLWKKHRKAGTYPAGFRTEVAPFADDLKNLAARQLEVMDPFWHGDSVALRTAFEDFGQGILYDAKLDATGNPRRPAQDRVHQMDGDSGIGMVGYHRWHTITRASLEDGAERGRWLEIDYFIGLAWAIQSEAKPVASRPNNPGLPATRIDQLRTKWLALSESQLDDAFTSFPYPAL